MDQRSQEAVLQVALRSAVQVRVAEQKSDCVAAGELPCRVRSLVQAGDIVSRIMNFGSATPIEVNQWFNLATRPARMR
jgi:hypothetical protein